MHLVKLPICVLAATRSCCVYNPQTTQQLQAALSFDQVAAKNASPDFHLPLQGRSLQACNDLTPLSSTANCSCATWQLAANVGYRKKPVGRSVRASASIAHAIGRKWLNSGMKTLYWERAAANSDSITLENNNLGRAASFCTACAW